MNGRGESATDIQNNEEGNQIKNRKNIKTSIKNQLMSLYEDSERRED